MYKTTFKDFMEQLYKKPYNQIPKKELKEQTAIYPTGTPRLT